MLSQLFLHPLGSFLFLFFGLHCLFSSSLLSVVFPFGSPEVSFLLFDVCSGLLYLLYTFRFPLFAAVALPSASFGVPVSLLACSVLLPRSPGVVFLAFFMVSSSFHSFCLLFVCLYIRLSLCWLTLVPPFCVLASVSSSFSPVRLLRLGFWTPYSLVGCSDFSLPPIAVLFWILASPFLFFVFLPCLPFFRSFLFHSPAFFLPIRRFVLSGCVSLHAALLFSSPLSAHSLLLQGFAVSLAIHLLRS